MNIEIVINTCMCFDLMGFGECQANWAIILWVCLQPYQCKQPYQCRSWSRYHDTCDTPHVWYTLCVLEVCYTLLGCLIKIHRKCQSLSGVSEGYAPKVHLWELYYGCTPQRTPTQQVYYRSSTPGSRCTPWFALGGEPSFGTRPVFALHWSNVVFRRAYAVSEWDTTQHKCGHREGLLPWQSANLRGSDEFQPGRGGTQSGTGLLSFCVLILSTDLGQAS